MIARTTLNRVTEVAGWILPAAALALVPKCPMCVAGYIAVATGVGVSLTAAGWIRTAMIVGPVALLVFLGFQRGRRWWRRTESQMDKRDCCRSR